MTDTSARDCLSSNPDHQLSAYNYILPESRIAQNPVTPRDRSKLMVIDGPHSLCHSHFYNLGDWLIPGDLLVFNDTKVIPARLYGQKISGASVEVLLIEPLIEPTESNRWLALVRPGKRIQPGTEILFGNSAQPLMSALVESRDEATGGRIIRLLPKVDKTIDTLIHQIGQMPLPPYITESTSLPEQYQTVFAQKKGAIAAPTAGLHFTRPLLDNLNAKGIQTAEITLHVGIGTFRPVEVSDIETHKMHKERIEVSAETVEKIKQTKANGGRVITVGTTSTRALEGVAAICDELQPYSGKTDLFIYPGYQWQVIDGMITNFHLPGSSLLMMVSALIGRQRLMSIYQAAIDQDYRFYSFGDAMLVLPEAAVKFSRE